MEGLRQLRVAKAELATPCDAVADVLAPAGATEHVADVALAQMKAPKAAILHSMCDSLADVVAWDLGILTRAREIARASPKTTRGLVWIFVRRLTFVPKKGLLLQKARCPEGTNAGGRAVPAELETRMSWKLGSRHRQLQAAQAEVARLQAELGADAGEDKRPQLAGLQAVIQRIGQSRCPR